MLTRDEVTAVSKFGGFLTHCMHNVFIHFRLHFLHGSVIVLV